MNIDFNDFFRLRVDVTKMSNDRGFHLVMENVFLDSSPADKGFHSSKKEYFLSKEQLKSLSSYLNEVADANN